MNDDQRLRIRIDDGQDEIISGFCKDCRWAQSNWLDRFFGTTQWSIALCLSPQRQIDLVTGSPKETFCENQRSFGECGRPGHWFEPR